jgi:phytanoyl-CoA hydroxylase
MNAKQIAEAVLSLRLHGYAIVQNFLPAGASAAAIAEINRLIDGFTPSKDEIALFGDNQQMKSKYFFDSADKISFFFEQKAWVNGELIAPKRQAINKIGHALHEHN